MASATTFVCPECDFEALHWSDGNPYYCDPDGTRHHVYHPSPRSYGPLDGNDPSLLCTACGQKLIGEVNDFSAGCPKCGSMSLVETRDLDGITCPACKRGTLRVDPTKMRIS